MSTNKDLEKEATLMALDQLAQTLEVMNSVVKRLRYSLTDNPAVNNNRPAVNPPKPQSKQPEKVKLH
ncbi:MAG: hypothetical protein OIF38_08300 [Cellvibrionaceae bacterium]|nr:hypothetical protein [Cellvibrionaceae bacterium]